MKKLELERDCLHTQAKNLQRELADRDADSSSFEMRINQRNSQIVDFQEQLNDKCLEVSKLEKKVKWTII